ncbi:hypothetical protein PRUPE_7G015400 [Prunus persica]|uniref:histone acetyltransferase n=1 Tax=Prunus persica TaxID=3760 RepID=A0A251N547_PRUPE|nr:hypothetical protein PRUPE_7G015400 [Prunus persica]
MADHDCKDLDMGYEDKPQEPESEGRSSPASALEIRKILDVLMHASKCPLAPASQCQYPNCRKIKGLFRHGIQCEDRVSGGCVLCQKMWYALLLHAPFYFMLELAKNLSAMCHVAAI